MANNDQLLAQAKARREELKKQAEAIRAHPAGDPAAPDQTEAEAAARKRAEDERRILAWSRGEEPGAAHNLLGGSRPRSGWLATGRPDSGYMDRISAGIRRLLGR